MMTTDTARKWTDGQLAKTNREVAKIYKQAQKELTEKWDSYMQKGGSRIKGFESAYTKALQSQDAMAIATAKSKLEQAKIAYTLQNDYYKEMVNSVTKEIAKVNGKALAYVNGTLANVYATNYEQAKHIVDGMGLSFTLTDKSTIKRMIKNGDIRLPKKKLNIPKDIQWNTRRINSAVLQGILQGESMKKIADRLLPIVNSNEASAIRNARTLVTGAENQGRLDSYEELEKQGLVLKKVWIATDGDRTREWHLDMDGQEVDIDEPFIDGHGNELMYPGDPDAEPETVYNCRCSMRMRVVGVKQKEDEEEGFDDSEALEYWDNTNNDEEPQSDLDAFMAEYSDTPIEEATETEIDVESDTDKYDPFSPDAYSEERKDEALWAQSSEEADEALRPSAEKAWQEASYEEKEGIFNYTEDSDDYNLPLRGFGEDWEDYIGTEDMTISQNIADRIDATTNYIDRCELEQDTWLQRGVGEGGAAAFLGIDEDMFYGSEEDMRDAILGKVVRDEAFCSHGSSKGSGFNGVIFNTYCPKGTKGAYCEPFSRFGQGAQSTDWDGISGQNYFGNELETLLQRGTDFEVTKISKRYGN